VQELVGKNIDIAPFGRIRYWTGHDPTTIEGHDARHLPDGAWVPQDVSEQGGPHLGVEWEYPRQFSSVAVRFADRNLPDPGELKLQYWVHSWPQDFRGGWTAVDDPFNGEWVTAHGEAAIDGDTWTFVFDPLDVTEIIRAADFAVTYRQAYRLRFLFRDGSAPEILGINVFSESVWREAALRISFAPDGMLHYGGRIEAHNGHVLAVDDSDPKSVAARILYAEDRNDGIERTAPWPPDRTVITVECVERSFSFLVRDALAGKVDIPDLGVSVEPSPPAPLPKRERGEISLPIYDRIATEPEQSYERARSEIPQLIKTRQGPWGRYCPIGCDANRQEFAVRYNGDIFADKEALKAVGRDTAKLLWPGKSIFFKFPTGDPPDFREREDGTEQEALKGYLPIYTSRWKDREIAYEMTTFAALLFESPWEEENKRGDEAVVALSRVIIRNTTEERRKARFWLVMESPEELEIDAEGFVYATSRARDESVPDSPIQKRWTVEKYPAPRLRALLDTRGRGKTEAVSCTYVPFDVSGISNAIAYEVELEPRGSHEIQVFIPFITFIGDEGREAIEALDYDVKLCEMTQYWDAQINSGASIRVPEELLTDFNRANLAHIAITADKDIKSGYHLLPAATYSYQVCMNEACHQIRSLDYRGHHERARKYLRPFYELQGTRPLHGRFKGQDGVFHGLRVDDETDYQTFNYNLDHGFVTFALCEHYKFTRDREWLRSIAQNLVEACDFVTRECQANMRTDASGQKVWEYGLLPPGHLEDNPEWLYWYTVNAYCYRGMKAVSEVLSDIGHPEADRIAREAAAYRQGIRNAMRRSMELSPVVRLADGLYSPFVPTRCHLRGRDLGWIRDSLYGPIHAIECGVLDPWEDMSTWILKDSEDNVFVSRYRGRQVDLERFWFSQGGNTIQSGLLPIVMVYLERDQPEHAIRALYNSLAQNLYADVRCFTEHPVAAFGLGAGPFYKTPDESCWINWLRNILLMEIRNTQSAIRNDEGLILAPGAPRKWFEPGKEFGVEEMATYFGPVSYRIASERDKITATIHPPRRNPPAMLEVRLRHPEKRRIAEVTVNGRPHSDFDPEREVVRFLRPGELPEKVEIVAVMSDE